MQKIGSSPTLTGIEKIINSFWFSDKYKVNPETLKIEHPAKDVKGFEVVKKNNRFYFKTV